MGLRAWTEERGGRWRDYDGYHSDQEGAFEALKGETIAKVEGMSKGSDSVTFTTSDGHTLELLHYQDCCERVEVEQVDGDAESLIGYPTLLAEERTVDVGGTLNGDGYSMESATATFYHLRTAKGDACIRWVGESNGYYSEAVTAVVNLHE